MIYQVKIRPTNLVDDGGQQEHQLTKVYEYASTVNVISLANILTNNTISNVKTEHNQQPLDAITSSTTTLDNSNVIYDNDTTLVLDLLQTQQPIKLQQQHTHQQPAPIIKSNGNYLNDSRRSSKGLNDFINSDRNEELESKENYATCLLEAMEKSNVSVSDLIGRLNFWQPINNGGVMHLLVRVRYHQLKGHQQQQQRQSKSIAKRESFRIPIEKPMDSDLNNSRSVKISENRYEKHLIWLVDNCSSGERKLLAEVSSTNTTANSLVDLDAELIVSQFNLTGNHNQISEKHLLFNLPNGQSIGCCKVNLIETLPVNELDMITSSVSVVQPTNEDLLPDRFQNKTSRD